MAIESVYQILTNLGLFDLIAPFITVFAFTYGVLRRTGIFGDKEKGYAVIAFSFAAYFVYNINVVQNTQEMLSLFFYTLLVALFFLMFLSFFFGRDPKSSFGKVGIGASGLMALIAVIYAIQYHPEEVASAVSPGNGWLYNFVQTYIIDTGLHVLLLILISFVVFVKFFTAEPKPQEAPKESKKDKVKKALEELGNLLTGEK